jgi:hypothetical protein
MKLRFVIALMLSLASPALSAQMPERPSTRVPAEELAAISARGRALAAYDRAAWQGSDAALPLLRQAPQGLLGRYVVRRTADGWEVVFGRGSASGDTFRIAYRARARGDGKFTAVRVEPVEEDTGFYARAARAQETGRRTFGPAGRPYNAVVLPVEGGEGDWWVYLLPAPTQTGIWPLGGDVRYRVSSDGRRVVEERRMHNDILESQANPDIIAGYHTAVLADRPEDSDVFLVLSRKPTFPDYIFSKTFVFRVNTDGSITPFDCRDAPVPWPFPR